MTLVTLTEIMDGIDSTCKRAKKENPLQVHHVRRILYRLEELGLIRLICLAGKEFAGADPFVSNEDFLTKINKKIPDKKEWDQTQNIR